MPIFHREYGQVLVLWFRQLFHQARLELSTPYPIMCPMLSSFAHQVHLFMRVVFPAGNGFYRWYNTTCEKSRIRRKYIDEYSEEI
ncbi:hypothetical protein TNCV_414191 [Trichonephila clavipes]|nr:hypothetical protein TNCV_414191 [Trichonephila clavipes]